MSTCLRDTEVSGMQMGLSLARPMTYSPSSSANSSPALGPAEHTSFVPATGSAGGGRAAGAVPVAVLRTAGR